MRLTTRNFLNVLEAVNECRHITAAYISVASAKAALTVATHGIYIATVALYEHCMLLAAAHIGHHDVEAADFWQVMNYLITAHAKLAIVVVYESNEFKGHRSHSVFHLLPQM